MDNNTTTPWCEKYRPTDLESIVLDPYNKKIFHNILECNYFPHLLFYGPPGVGKTTTADNLINNYQSKYSKINKENIIHLNASDERGIEVIRTQIHQFVKSYNMFAKGLKIVVLDEVDYMTKNAQQALKNLIQSCLDNVRFILICNYICKIDESLQKEFTCIRFNKLPAEEVYKLIENITQNEKIYISKETISTIQNMFHSDIRSMINYIQLNQNKLDIGYKLFHNLVCHELHEMFLNNNQNIKNWLYDVSQNYSIDMKTIVTKYANYIIEYEKHYLTNDFLNVIEVLVHVNDSFNIDFFVHHIQKSYNLKHYSKN
jgi:replication factor C subunit 3/5